MVLKINQAEWGNGMHVRMTFARNIFEYASTTAVFDKNIYLKKHSVHADFIKNSKIIDAIDKIYDLAQNERKELYIAFCNDCDYYKNINNTEYRFKEITKKQKYIMENFMSELIYKKEERAAYLEEYSNINKQYCPICRSAVAFKAGRGHIDHYFPKSEYPALMIHPKNLVPTCSDCNGPSAKHTKNPIHDDDIDKHQLLTVFIPYLRQAADEVRYSINEDSRKRVVEILPGRQADDYTEKRIQNLERLYNLSEIWSVHLETSYESLAAECKNKRLSNERIPKCIELRNILNNLINDYVLKNKIDMNSFVDSVFYKWLSDLDDQYLCEIIQI